MAILNVIHEIGDYSAPRAISEQDLQDYDAMNGTSYSAEEQRKRRERERNSCIDNRLDNRSTYRDDFDYRFQNRRS